MANNTAPRDGNYKAVIQGVSSLDFASTTNIAVNPSTHAILVETSGGGGGTQYAEGDTDSPATGTVALGRYNATPPTLVDGELFALQFDSSGKLLVSASLTPSGTQDVNLTEVGGTSFALGQQLAAASIPVVLTASQLSTLTPLSTVAVTQSTSPWVVSNGGTFPVQVSSALPAGANVIGHVITDTGSTTAVTGTVTISGAVTQGTSPWIVAGGGTAGTAATGVVTVQGIASMTPILSTLQTQTDTVMVGGVNIKEINAVTPLMGNGVTGTGSQRVTIASNNTAFSVNPLSATTPVSTMNSASANSGVNSAMAAVVDDTSPTAITENNFGFIRMSADRSLLITPRALTPTQSTVASSASNVTLLAATNARKGATIVNDSSALLYIKLGATASTTSYSVVLSGAASAPFAYYEVPFGYVGIIDGIWGSATGNARITELS